MNNAALKATVTAAAQIEAAAVINDCAALSLSVSCSHCSASKLRANHGKLRRNTSSEASSAALDRTVFRLMLFLNAEYKSIQGQCFQTLRATLVNIKISPRKIGGLIRSVLCFSRLTHCNFTDNELNLK